MAFTEKGLAAIEIIRRDYSTTETFTAAKLGVAPAVLTSLAKDGYLIRQDTKPVSYICDASCREKIDEDYPKSFAPYSAEEMVMQIKMTYQELVAYCINKYGRVSGTYFCTPEMKSENSKIKRGGEGLYVHHIMEDRAIMLGNSLFAKEQPWEYQMPHNLVYCNIFEHLLLHICIINEYDENKLEDHRVLPGVGGAYNYIWPQIRQNYLYNTHTNVSFKNITFEQYKEVLLPHIVKAMETPLYRKFSAAKDVFRIASQSKESCAKTSPSKQVLHNKKRVKRSDGRIFDSLYEASRLYGTKKHRAKKEREIKRAIAKHIKYDGFYWEYITEDA